LVLNRGEEGWKKKCLSSTGRAEKEPIWNNRKQRKGGKEEEGEEISK